MPYSSINSLARPKLPTLDGRNGGGVIEATLTGGPAGETIPGTASADMISGLGGDDLLQGLGGDDTLDGGADDDTLDGGEGSDTVSYASAPGALFIDLGDSAPQDTDSAGIDVLISIENVIGTNLEDSITGDGNANRLAGRGGADDLFGADGDDTLEGGAGDDTLSGGNGVDTASYATALGAVFIDLSDTGPQDTDSAGIDVLSGIENVIGTGLEDSITGDAGANRLVGGDGSDDLFGAGGNDTLEGGGGDDTLSGAGGVDTVSFASALAGVTVDLTEMDSQNTGEGNDVITGVENVTGSGHDDALTGDGAANDLSGGAGADTLAGGVGNDTLGGGQGRDLADYSDASAGVTVSLQSTSGQNTGGAGTDTLSGIEDLLGSTSNDLLTGNFLGNRLDGGDGGDWLRGGLGNDTLVGGAGADRVLGNSDDDDLSGGANDDLLRGGEGADTISGGLGRDRMWGATEADVFDFDSVAESAVGKLRDLIQDFEHGVDLIDLSGIDADGAGGGDGTFTWLNGTAFTGAGAELTFAVVARGVIVSADIDGDTMADFEIRLTGATEVDADDFVL